METLVAVLIYLHSVNVGCSCYTQQEIVDIANAHAPEVNVVYENSDELNQLTNEYGPMFYEVVRDDVDPIGTWVPDDGEIAY